MKICTYKVWMFVWVAFFASCSIPTDKLDEAVKRADNSQELLLLKEELALISERLEDDEPYSDDVGSEHGHGHSTATEVEILKLLQKLNQKIVVLEQGLNNGRTEANDKVTKRQVIEAAGQAMANHPDIGPSYISNPSNTKVKKSDEQGVWDVNIRFKLNVGDSDIYNATMKCFVIDAEMQCPELDIEAE